VADKSKKKLSYEVIRVTFNQKIMIVSPRFDIINNTDEMGSER